MLDTIIRIISAILFGLLFNYLFYKLNYRFCLFESVQSKTENLNEDNNKKLRVISYIVIIILLCIITEWKINHIIQGLLVGLLFSIRDICFKDTIMDNILK